MDYATYQVGVLQEIIVKKHTSSKQCWNRTNDLFSSSLLP